MLEPHDNAEVGSRLRGYIFVKRDRREHCIRDNERELIRNASAWTQDRDETSLWKISNLVLICPVSCGLGQNLVHIVHSSIGGLGMRITTFHTPVLLCIMSIEHQRWIILKTHF